MVFVMLSCPQGNKMFPHRYKLFITVLSVLLGNVGAVVVGALETLGGKSALIKQAIRRKRGCF